jgi:hypothetical protein
MPTDKETVVDMVNLMLSTGDMLIEQVVLHCRVPVYASNLGMPCQWAAISTEFRVINKCLE